MFKTKEEIRALRKELGMTQYDFGKILGYDRHYQQKISNLERGVFGITLKTRILCLALKLIHERGLMNIFKKTLYKL